MIYQTGPDWKVYKFEREFTDPKEYEEFISQHPDLDFRNFPRLSLNEWTSLERWIDELIWKKLNMISGYLTNFFNEVGSKEYEEDVPLDVNFREYEMELQKLEEERKKIENKRKKLEDALKKLEDYRRRFKEAGKKDLVENVEKDIKKVKEELKKLDEQMKEKKKNK